MNKVLKFSYTKDGMITVPGQRGDFVSVNEMIGVLSECINEKTRILENYKDVDESSQDWKGKQKAIYEGQKEELEKIRRLLY